MEVLNLRTKGLGSKIRELVICPIYSNLPSDMQVDKRSGEDVIGVIHTYIAFVTPCSVGNDNMPYMLCRCLSGSDIMIGPHLRACAGGCAQGGDRHKHRRDQSDHRRHLLRHRHRVLQAEVLQSEDRNGITHRCPSSFFSIWSMCDSVVVVLGALIILSMK